MTQNTDRKTNSLWNIAKLILAIFLVGFVFSKTDLGQIVDSLKNISVYWLVVSLLVFLLTTLVKAGQYYLLLMKRVTYLQILNAAILQNVVSNFLATGAGIASLIGSLRVEHGVKLGNSMTMFLLTKIGDLTAIWLALLVSSFFVWPRIAVLHILVITLILAIGAALLVFVLVVLYRQRAITIIRSLLDRLKVSSIGLVAKALDIVQSLSEIDTQKALRTLLVTTAASVVYLACSIFWAYANLMVFNIRVGAAGIVFAIVLIQLISYFPIQVFGGLGVSETSSLYILGFFDISQQILAPALIGVRILSYLFNLIPLIYLPIYAAFFPKKPEL